MATFFDGFDRANGPIGPNYANGWTAATVSGGNVISTAWFSTNCVVCTATDRHDATTHLYYAGASGTWAGPAVKMYGASRQCYYMGVVLITGVYNLRVGYNNGVSDSSIVYVPLAGSPGAYCTQRLVWDAGVLYAYVNGELIWQGEHVSLAGNSYMGMYGYGSQNPVADFSCEGVLSVALDVEPNIIGNYGACSPLTLTGTGTNWTPGTPGSPIFTVNHGTISQQTIVDATHASITYCPGTYLGAVIFTDPSTSATDGAIVTSDPSVVPPTGLSLSADAIAYIERSAIAQVNPTILNREQIISSAGSSIDFRSAIGEIHLGTHNDAYVQSDQTPTEETAKVIWDILTHKQPAGLDNSFRDVLSQILTNTGELIEPWQVDETIGRWKVDEILNILAGIPRKSHQDILDAIANVSGGDPQAIIAAIEAARGTNLPAISDVLDLLGVIATPTNYNLGDIITAIGNIQPGGGADLTPVLNAIAALRGDNVSSVMNVTERVAAIRTIVDSLSTSLAAVRTGNGYTIQTILDAIANISGGSNADVLAALTALRGDNVSTIKAILDSITQYRTGNNYTVQNILDAIKATPEGTDWTVPALGLLLLLLLLGLAAPEAVAVAAGGAGAIGIITAIIEAMGDVSDIISRVWTWWSAASQWRAVPSAPTFPGNERVEYQETVPFEDAVRVPGVMDGAIIRISTPGKAPYAIKEALETRYARLGTFAFQCEETAYEHIQPIQFLAQLATPKAMNTAIAILVQCKPGTIGTVTPYTLTYPGPWPFGNIRLP